MKISVAYANHETQVWHSYDVDDNATVEEALKSSGFLDLFPHIDLSQQKVGIYGKFTKLNAKVSEGDRIELYQPVTRIPDEDEDDED